MGQTPDELREEIESARNDLGETLGAIGDKVSPKRIAQRRVDRARSGMTQVRDRLMGSASDTYDSASARLGDAGRSVAETGQSIGTTATEAGQTLVDTGRQAPEMVAQRTQGNPLGMGLIAFGIGAVVASLIPETEAETRQAQTLKESVVEPVKEELTEAGKAVAADLKESAAASKDAVVEKAQTGVQQVQEAGKESVVNIREEAKGSAETVKATAQESTESVKSEAQGASSEPSI